VRREQAKAAAGGFERERMSSKYDTEPELTSENNSHTMIVELVGHDKTVLDVGAATGYVAELLGERGCKVTGIEVDPDAARKAEEHCERVITGDIENLDLQAELGEASFDVIVFGDVLEHLKEPLEVLKRFKPFLSPEGYVVASIPNVAHGSVRLALLQGKFRYQSLGLMDDTHLRFFTRETVEQMFTDAGFVITELNRTRLGMFNTEVEVDRELLPRGIVKEIQNSPESQTYQFVFKAYPLDGSKEFVRLTIENSRLSEQLAEKQGEDSQLSEQLAERDRTIYEQERKLRNLERLEALSETQGEQLSEKESEVKELTQEVAKLRRQIAWLRPPQGGGS
jgi:2-polyprenyl-3-methyl-5-hydroxy-6-metoxy-1,4-benzoquinol methylase